MTDLPRQFKGVWIPAEVWLDRSLSITEKVMMVEIGSLQDPVRGCYASNSHFARFFGLSSSRVSEIISALSSKGLLRVELIRDGRQVVERRVRLSDLFGKSNTYSEKAATLFGKGGDPYSEKAEESNTKSNSTSEGEKQPRLPRPLRARPRSSILSLRALSASANQPGLTGASTAAKSRSL